MFDFFTDKTKKETISIYPVRTDDFDKWFEKRSDNTKSQVMIARFTAKAGEVIIIRNSKGELKKVYYGVSSPISIYDIASLPSFIQSRISDDALKTSVFELKEVRSKRDLESLTLGWGLGCYRFSKYKTRNDDKPWPILKLPKQISESTILEQIAGIFLCRDLINEPANKLGPQELVDEAKRLSKEHKAKCTIIQDEDLVKKNYPLVYAVGKASERRPALIDLKWGKKNHPKITLVGKGVCFDTGGVNVKPGQFMRSMKKDMGGAAHVLGLAHAIMLAKLPIQLRVLVPAVENAIAGNAFRPDDVLPSRKGITVEIDNTDAEGRLVLADALYEGSSEKPELIIDFATLTGAARVATGHQIPPFFCNRHELEHTIKKTSFRVEDPVWPLPLWKGYRKDLSSEIADMTHMGKSRAGHITAALFLQEFIENETLWLHFDVYAWSDGGIPGAPKGGRDMGLRTIFSYLEETYKKAA